MAKKYLLAILLPAICLHGTAFASISDDFGIGGYNSPDASWWKGDGLTLTPSYQIDGGQKNTFNKSTGALISADNTTTQTWGGELKYAARHLALTVDYTDQNGWQKSETSGVSKDTDEDIGKVTIEWRPFVNPSQREIDQASIDPVVVTNSTPDSYWYNLKITPSYTFRATKDTVTSDDSGDLYTRDGDKSGLDISDAYALEYTFSEGIFKPTANIDASITYMGSSEQFPSLNKPNASITEAYWQKSVTPAFKPEFDFEYFKVTGIAGVEFNFGTVKAINSNPDLSNRGLSSQRVGDFGAEFDLLRPKIGTQWQEYLPQLSLKYDHKIYSNGENLYYSEPGNDTTTKDNIDDIVLAKLSWKLD